MVRPRNSWGLGAAIALALACGGALAQGQQPVAEAPDARSFFARLWPIAQARGVSRGVFDAVTAAFVPDPDVLTLAASQPEHAKPAGAYMTGLVTDAAIDAGRRKAAENAELLAAIEATYGVDRHILLAVWRVESAYGAEKGSRGLVRSLATLAMSDARRAPFWRGELIAALRIIEDGAATAEALVGSWAGATGHTQFIPSTYRAHAVDFDRDGRRDIWTSVADALASTANYLRASGWTAGAAWGFEVMLPARFDWSALGRSRAFAEWQAAGIALPRATPIAPGNHTLQLVVPAGARGPAFLVTPNYRALLRYNRSHAYALTVGHLADRIAGGSPLAAVWPVDDWPLGRAERQELQRLLAARGHDTGGFDGIIGDQTRAAIAATQRGFALPPDGHATLELLYRLRHDVAP